MALLDQVSFTILLFGCATLGLAPFVPEPHIWGKLKMLRAGTLKKPIDWFDLALHAAPFVLLLLKIIREATR